MTDSSGPLLPQEVVRGAAALQSREAGYSVAKKCLELQSEAERANPSLRTGKQVTLHSDAWAWYVGALGEIEVGVMLASLGSEWMVRHAVPIGSGTADIDHLVIGPGGVFAINTKHSAGSSIWVGDHVLRVNNHNTHFVTRARGETSNAAQRLTRRCGFSVPVISILAFVRPSSIKDVRVEGRSWPVVLDANELVPALERQTAALSHEQLAVVRQAAEDPRTWHTDAEAADTVRVMQRFHRLVAAVGHNPPPPVTNSVEPSWVEGTGRSRYSSRAPRSRMSRRGGPPRVSKREAARRARRAEDLIKLGLLLLAGLTYPMWGPGVIQAFTSSLTSAITP